MKKIACLLSCLVLIFTPSLHAEEDVSKTDTDTSSSSSIGGIAKGVKKVAYEGPKDLVTETAKEAKKPTLTNVVEGVNKGTEKFLDHTIKGTFRVATLGKWEPESYKVQEPEKGSDEPTKFTIEIPGT